MNKNKLPILLNGLKEAYEECWKAKIATNDVAKKYAPLCVQIMQEMGYVPELINNRIQERIRSTDGMDVLSEDFWSNEDMIISLFEHLENEYEWEVANVPCAS